MVRYVATGSSLLALAVFVTGVVLFVPLTQRDSSSVPGIVILTCLTGLSLAIASSSYLYGRDKSLGSFMVLAAATILLTPLVMATAFGAGMLFAPAVIAGFLALVAIGMPGRRA